MPRTILGVKLYTLAEAAELLGVCRTTVGMYIKKKNLNSQTIGGVKYVSEQSLKDFLQNI